MAETHLTPQALGRVQADLEHLETEGRREIRARLQLAREDGDLRENAGYDHAREDQAFLEARIVELRHTLDTAIVLDDAVADNDSVTPGSSVVLRHGDGSEEAYVYGSRFDTSDDAALVSPSSPLGEALGGRRVGDTVSYQAPAGEFQVEIISVERT